MENMHTKHASSGLFKSTTTTFLWSGRALGVDISKHLQKLCNIYCAVRYEDYL